MDTKEFIQGWKDICTTYYSEYAECAFCPIEANCYAGRMGDETPEEYIGDMAGLIDAVRRYTNGQN